MRAFGPQSLPPKLKRPKPPPRYIAAMRLNYEGGMVLELPIMLRPESNMREHWAKKAKRVQTQRGQVRLERQAFSGIKLPCSVVVTRVAPRPLDDDNATRSAKGVRDEVAALLGVDDRDPRVTFKVDQERRGVRVYGVVIKITETP